MVALLKNDIYPFVPQASRLARAGQFESVVHTVGSRSELPFGLGRRTQFLFALVALVFALVLTVKFAQWQSASALAGNVHPDSALSGVSIDAEVDPSARREAPQTLIVRPGDTLWQIATELAPGQDPRPVVDQLVEANGSSIYAGQEIIIPGEFVA